MKDVADAQPHKARFLNATMFAVCLAAWIMNVVLLILLVQSDVLEWGPVELGLLIGIPILAGSVVSLMLFLFDERRRGTQS